jgi:hypothetical protein
MKTLLAGIALAIAMLSASEAFALPYCTGGTFTDGHYVCTSLDDNQYCRPAAFRRPAQSRNNRRTLSAPTARSVKEAAQIRKDLRSAPVIAVAMPNPNSKATMPRSIAEKLSVGGRITYDDYGIG